MNLYLPAISNNTIPLHTAFARHGMLFGMATSLSELADENVYNLFFHHSKMVVPADSMKMAVVQPVQGEFNHIQNDVLLNVSQVIGHGHCLLWGQRYPSWLMPALESSTPGQCLALLNDHVSECMTHYSNWLTMDVVNEAYVLPTPWDRFIPNSIRVALQFAKDANPNLPRFYNGVFLGIPKEQSKVLQLLEDGLIEGVGIQWHRKAGANDSFWIPELKQFAKNVKSLGGVLRFSEVTIKPNGSEADFNFKWAEAVRLALDIEPTCFVQWGIHDTSDSWQGDSLLFDRQGEPKSAYYTVLDVLG